MITTFEDFEVWFVTGSQHLYGEETLQKVNKHSQEIVHYLNDRNEIPVKIMFKPVVTTPDEINNLAREAEYNTNCIGWICWMHTFSPAKMWINALKHLRKPFLHLHTQYNDQIPWSGIDMDFINLNQSAHGDREFGFIVSRMNKHRKVVVGHWKDAEVTHKIGRWTRVSAAWADSQTMKLARIGDNMRHVAVTEGNKVSAQIQFGYQVNGFGVGDLVNYINDVAEVEIIHTIRDYEEAYDLMTSLQASGDMRESLIEAARIEVGLRHFLTDGGFTAFTDTFEDLHGMIQLPGIAVQRLMAEGYGFAGEGDWKTAALVRTMKVMAFGLEGGNSFMEDYTYHFHPKGDRVLGAHMLEICPSITSEKPKCEVHPLGIGGKADPVRLVFNGDEGEALNASMVEMGDRFRLIINKVKAVAPYEIMPKLPVARVLWDPLPNLKTAAEAWILAGGSHHTCYSQNISAEDLLEYACIAGIESILIDEKMDGHHSIKRPLN